MEYKGARTLFFIMFCLIFFQSGIAFAVCADPVGQKGDIVFNDTYSTMMFCDGTVWWDMKAGTGSVWFRSGNDISYSSGNVGVGTNAPVSTLHVAGDLLLENSGICEGGGVNKGALRLNAAADALEICDGAGTWLPFTTSTGTGGSGGTPASGGSLLADWPDAIKCADSTTSVVLYLRNFDATHVAYAPPQVASNPQYILYDKATGDYFSHSNMAGFDCVSNGWSIANIETANRAFSLVSNGSGLSDTTNCTDGDKIFFDSSSGGLRCPDKTPDAFSFTDQTNVNVSTQSESDIVQITGIEARVPVSISGDGSPEFRTCSDPACSTEIQTWGSTAQTISNGNYLQLRLTSNSAITTTDSATVSVGTASSQWSVATGACSSGSQSYTTPGSYSFDVVASNANCTITVTVSGAGGGGGGRGDCNGNTVTNGSAGGQSSFNGTVIAYGGQGGKKGTPDDGVNGAVGADGTATGGDTNQTGGGAAGRGTGSGVCDLGGRGGYGGLATIAYAPGTFSMGASPTVVVGAGGAGGRDANGSYAKNGDDGSVSISWAP